MPDPIKYSLGSLCLAFAVCLIDRSDRRILALLSHPIFVRMGLCSFSIYLWQQPVIHFVAKGYGKIAVLGLVAASLTSFYLIEQPARRFLNKRWAKSSTGSATSPPSIVATSPA